MASKQPAKSHQLTVRLEPSIHESLTIIGARIGVKPAVLAGMAIGDYVARSEATYSAASEMQDRVASDVAVLLEKQFALIFSPEQIEKMLSE